MKNTFTIISGAILVLGCLTLGISLLVAAVMPNVFLAYLMANAQSFSSDILHPNMTVLYIFSAIEIVAGIAGIFYQRKKS